MKALTLSDTRILRYTVDAIKIAFQFFFKLVLASNLSTGANLGSLFGSYIENTTNNTNELNLAPCSYFIAVENKYYNAECGFLSVPENRNKIGSPLIEIPITKILSESPSDLEPVFWFQGGPGSKNNFNYPVDGLISNHDFVLVGYRGAEGSSLLECPELRDTLSKSKKPFLSEVSLNSYSLSTEACAKRLTSEGFDIEGVSLNQTVEDFEYARNALGYKKINLYGNSFGTRLQMIYQWRFPQKVNRSIMVGVNPPGRFVWSQQDTQDLILQYSSLCNESPFCRARTSNLVSTMWAVSKNIPDSWMGISIDSDLINLVTFMGLMESASTPNGSLSLSAPSVLDMWLDASEGDFSAMAFVSLIAPFIIADMHQWGHSIAMGASSLDYNQTERDYKDEFLPKNTIIGAPFSQLFHSLSLGWSTNSGAAAGSNAAIKSDVETLLISGQLDGATPMRYARDELLPMLSNGHHVILQGQGHTETFWNSQTNARSTLLNSFFSSGLVDDTLYQDQIIEFDISFGFGEVAVFLLIALFVLCGVMILVITKLYLKCQKRSFRN